MGHRPANGERSVVKAKQYVPERGDVAWISFDPKTGHEQAGRRPAVVLSPGSYNRKVGMALVCPVTSQGKGYGFEVPIPEGLAVSGVVLADHVRNIDWRARKITFVCTLPEETVAEIRQAIIDLMTTD
jgi:mRNA interferase MazF